MGTDSPKASSRLREMELESEIEEHELQTALAGGSQTPAPLEIAIKPSSRTRVVDGSDERDRESLLKKKHPKGESSAPPLDRKMLVIVVAATASVALLILWLLFRGQPSIRDETFDFLPPPMTYSELLIAQPNNACPQLDWLPIPCGTEERLKSKTIHDKCHDWFERYGYTIDLLKTCKIIEFVG